ncbi:integrase core domain-containing protein [Nioella sp.]|uniref:integrase core domain-containing protein n=1 Tax=Nioella sp. TaxID=1912091 RepID=UPI003A89BF7A
MLLSGSMDQSAVTQKIGHSRRNHYNTKRPHSALGYRPPAPETIIPMDQRPTMH